MSSKHTPGPWTIEKTAGGWGVRAPSWGYVAIHSDGNPPHWEEGQAANRLLIAAAPELLDALQAMVTSYEHEASMSNPALESARAAIAKATGEQA